MKRALRNKSSGEEAISYPVSGRGYAHVCPSCGEPLALYDLRDGDQAYWCDPCGKGHRAGDPPVRALRPLPHAG